MITTIISKEVHLLLYVGTPAVGNITDRSSIIIIFVKNIKYKRGLKLERLSEIWKQYTIRLHYRYVKQINMLSITFLDKCIGGFQVGAGGFQVGAGVRAPPLLPII